MTVNNHDISKIKYFVIMEGIFTSPASNLIGLNSITGRDF